MSDFDYLLELPGPPGEREWIRERLETLSVREGYTLAAAAMRHPPEDTGEAVERLRSLEDYGICFPAGNYEQLGGLYLRLDSDIPKDVLPYVNLDHLGRMYEDEHPGLFVGQCYVVYPDGSPVPGCQEKKCTPLLDDGWSVKLKLASPAVPEGVWLRLPDYSEQAYGHSIEAALAMDALNVKSLEECTLLDARCILPEAGDLMAQYSSIEELFQDGSNLGYAMGEQGQGEEHWMEKFFAALEREDCRTLKFALDISQNIRCYEWVSCKGLADFGASYLRGEGMSEEIIQSGGVDLEGYAENLLETAGFMLTRNETGYIARNNREFIREFTAPDGAGMTMQ